jgi:2-polyprenyl-3-methyl-5-hydroxy-6-metoxy-1,4-benzoquinol methylase
VEPQTVPDSIEAQNEIVRDAWNANAAFWDERMGEGNDWHLQLIRPAVERLLEVQPGQRILDAACGNGLFSRRLAELGATVVAFDFSASMIERANARSRPVADRVTYQVIDATDEESLRTLAGEPFDSVVCNMALMDVADIDPLVRVSSELLAPRGRFVFSLSHPCFNSNTNALIAERSVTDGGMQYSIKVSAYKEPVVAFGDAIYGQPAKQLYFDRSLEDLFGTFFSAGYVLDGLLEPAFSNGESKGDSPSWSNLWRIPPVLVGRMKLAVGRP